MSHNRFRKYPAEGDPRNWKKGDRLKVTPWGSVDTTRNGQFACGSFHKLLGYEGYGEVALPGEKGGNLVLVRMDPRN